VDRERVEAPHHPRVGAVGGRLADPEPAADLAEADTPLAQRHDLGFSVRIEIFWAADWALGQ
jgi:hypothetical protein